MERLKLSLCALIGVLLTVLVAVIVFPIRARTILRKRTAMLLERMGNLAFYLMGEFCEASPSLHSAAQTPYQPVGSLSSPWDGPALHECVGYHDTLDILGTEAARQNTDAAVTVRQPWRDARRLLEVPACA